jgi:hypothetical protein
MPRCPWFSASHSAKPSAPCLVIVYPGPDGPVISAAEETACSR